MPANLTPQYAKAEEEFKQAKTAEDRLAALRKMYSLLPKHKGTEKLQAELKRKISDFKDEVEHAKKTGRKGVSYKIPRQGGGQVVILGAPNAGKSRLLSRLTRATPEVAPYPFTTREPQPGMMSWEDVAIQLVDTPPITAEFMEGWLSSLIRGADAALLLVDLGTDDGPSQADDVIHRLEQAKTILTGTPEAVEDEATIQVKTLLVPNKVDLPGAEDRLQFVVEMYGGRFPHCAISAEHGQGLEDLRNQIYRFLDIIRVYTKQPGKPPDLEAPFTCPAGSTLLDLASLVHRDFADRLKHARIWGTGVYDGQTVKRDHVLHDKDIVELHI